MVSHTANRPLPLLTLESGTIVKDSEMGEVIQLQGDQRKDVREFLIDKKEGLQIDSKIIKVFKSARPTMLRTVS